VSEVMTEVVQPDWRTYPDLQLHPILSSALSHFQTLGYHGTTVRQIASGVGLTMPTLYYHYSNKEGILSALLTIAMEDLQSHVDMGLADAGKNTQKRFQNFIATIALHYTHRRDLSLLHDEFRFLTEGAREAYVSRRTAIERTLENILQDGVTEGLFRDEDPHVTARVLLGMMTGIVAWYSRAGSMGADDIADRYVQYALRLVSANRV
jgi:AcrR family transcriptional regulator